MKYGTKRFLLKTLSWGSFCVLVLLSVAVFALYGISHSITNVISEDRYFMNIAYEESKKALETNDFPVGAVLVINAVIAARAHNEVRAGNDYRNHAEMIVINKALEKLNAPDFSGVKGKIVLYTTYEPCAMCEGFIKWTKVPRVIVGKRKSTLSQFKKDFWDWAVYRYRMRGGIEEQVFQAMWDEYNGTVKPRSEGLKNIGD